MAEMCAGSYPFPRPDLSPDCPWNYTSKSYCPLMAKQPADGEVEIMFISLPQAFWSPTLRACSTCFMGDAARW